MLSVVDGLSRFRVNWSVRVDDRGYQPAMSVFRNTRFLAVPALHRQCLYVVLTRSTCET